MAISIAFGLMSATVLILMVLPCFLVIVDDIKAAAYFLWNGQSRNGATMVDQDLIELDLDKA
ncbi:MAG: hypothetical protein IID30_13035 [Planctomycetes bacterium]|nr:hypothetical protein [Planctomycetota bacterium]